MIGFDGRHQWRQHKLFKLRAKLVQYKIYKFHKALPTMPQTFARRNPHGKFAIRLFIELRFAQFLCAAQELSSGSSRQFQAPR
jgi:hypothetical protein